MNLCLNAFVIQFPNGLLDTCSVTAPRALLLPYAHRSHCKEEDSYKEYWSHVEFSVSLTRQGLAAANESALAISCSILIITTGGNKQARRRLQRLVRSS